MEGYPRLIPNERVRGSKLRRRPNWLDSQDPKELTLWQKQFIAVNWEATSVGLISSWEPWLKNLVLTLMADPQPALLLVDDDQEVSSCIIYNEAYWPVIGDKHPGLQGGDPKIAFAEFWDKVALYLDRCRNYETSVNASDYAEQTRHGFCEDTWFHNRFMPMLTPDGYFGATYIICADATQAWIARRREGVLKSIMDHMTDLDDGAQLWTEVHKVLTNATVDVPCALFYSELYYGTEDSSYQNCNQYRLESVIGTDLYFAAPKTVDLHGVSPFEAAICTAIYSGKLFMISSEILPLQLRVSLKSRTNGQLCRGAMICPVRSRSHDYTFGLMIIGLDPRAQYTDQTNVFFSEVCRHLNSVFTRHALKNQLRQQTVEIAESDRKFKFLTSRAPIGIAITRPDGTIKYCNDHWFALVQWRPSSMADKYWHHRIYEEDKANALAAWDEVLAGADDITVQFRLLTQRSKTGANGGEGPITVMCRIYSDKAENGSIKHIMSCLVDISDIKDLESRLRARTMEVETEIEHLLKVKKRQEQFIDMTSHEVRNPLSAVLHLAEDIYTTNRDMLQLLRCCSDNVNGVEKLLDSTKDSAETIMSCVLHQKRIVDDILVVSRLESGALVVTAVPTQPKNLIQKALRMFEAEARSSNTTLSFVEDASLETLNIHTLLFDSSRIVQILVNLVGNAIKFTKLEEVRSIKVIMAASLVRPSDKSADIEYIPVSENTQIQAFDEEGEIVWLSLSVIDTGPGLSVADTQKLFKRFSQGTMKTHTQYGGSGLGLFIAKQLTEIHGGQIGLASEKNQGSNFTFFVKTVRCSASTQSTSPSVHAASPCPSKTDIDNTNIIELPTPADSPDQIFRRMPAKPLTVLVVEDNIVNQKILVQLLTKKGCKVHVANHGLEALDFLCKTQYYWSADSKECIDLSIILLDSEMPVMDGLTAVRHIREMERTGKLSSHIPVLAVTANARHEQINTMMTAGMDEHIAKPYHIDDMMKKIYALVV